MKPVSSLLSQQRNLILFRAFCAMKYAIYALCVNAHRHANCKDCVTHFASDLCGELPDLNEPADQPLLPGLVVCAYLKGKKIIVCPCALQREVRS